MPLIGTAGHVDHGKSTLVRALTGRDPDRWDEEKRRGLTIDLGFAWADLGNGVIASFVDVPGHERYLKNMLAGVEAIDVGLLVVAANEGWKPQTEEHAAVLHLLGVKNTVVALSKVDLVDTETAQLVAIEIEEHLAGTVLESSPVVAVSSTTGTGLTVLRQHLVDAISTIGARNGPPRLWVDRVFKVPGAGTVVTGSLLNSELAVGDEVQLHPGGTARVRTIQSHEESLDLAQPGTRVAIGIAGSDGSGLARGTMIGLPGQWRATDRFSAKLSLARYIDDLPERGAYQIHIGTLAQNVRVEAKEENRAILQLSRPVPAAMGDRFILRDSGRRVVAAGGRVLDPHPGKIRRALREAVGLDPEASSEQRASQLLHLRGSETVANLERDSGGGIPTDALEISGSMITQTRLEEHIEAATRLVEEEHVKRPLNPGLPLATLATRLGVGASLAEEVVNRAAPLELRGPDVASTTHTASLSPELERIWDEVRPKLGKSLSVPSSSDLGLSTEALHLLGRTGQLVRVSKDLAYLPEQIDQILAALREMASPFSIPEFKERLGLSRKYAVPLLEWLDSNQYTTRRGDQRWFGPRLSGNS